MIIPWEGERGSQHVDHFHVLAQVFRTMFSSSIMRFVITKLKMMIDISSESSAYQAFFPHKTANFFSVSVCR